MPPGCRTAFVHEFDEHTCDYGVHNYRLALPWQVYVLTFTPTFLCSLQLAFRNAPVTPEDSEVFCPPLWNMNPYSLSMCLGGSSVNWYGNLDAFCDGAISAVWGSIWLREETLHLMYRDSGSYGRDRRVCTPSGPDWNAWAHHTALDPGFATTVRWKPWGDLSKLVGCFADISRYWSAGR
jgi:hypothetical protein